MAKAPTTYDELFGYGLREREAFTLAVVLPNLPRDDVVIWLRGWQVEPSDDPSFDTPDDELEAFRRYEDPIVPGSRLYRVRIVKTDGDDYYDGVRVVPHGRRKYGLVRSDFAEFVKVDPEDAAFDDTNQSGLDRYGFGSPYLNPYYANRDAFGRDPKLPV